MMRTSQFAFVVSGFATVVAMSALIYTRNNIGALEDDVLRLKAENETLKVRLEESERDLMLALALRMEGLRADLGLESGEVAAAEVEPYPETLISRIGAPTESAGEVKVEVPAEVLQSVLADPERLAAEVTLTPDVKNKRPAGYRLYETRTGGLALALGFELGDVIHAVNGMPFHSEDEIATVYRALSGNGGNGPIAIDFSREGKKRRLVVEVRP